MSKMPKSQTIKYLAIIALLVVMVATMFFLAQSIADLAGQKSAVTGLVMEPISVDRLWPFKQPVKPHVMEPISVD